MMSTPLFTRLYSPTDFGLNAVYLSIVTILLVLSTMRLEVAIPLPESDVDAANLLGLAVVAVGSVSLMVGVVCGLWGRSLLALLHAPALHPYLWLLPFGIGGGGAYLALSMWAMRQRDYNRLAMTKVYQGAAQVVVQAGLGLVPAFGPLGLLLGSDVGRWSGTATLARSAWRRDSGALRAISWVRMRAMALRYREFPLVGAGSALLNTLGLQLPPLILVAFFDPHIVGFFALSQRVIAIPMGVIGGAISQVFVAEGAALLRVTPQHFPHLLRRMGRRLFWSGVVPILVLALVAPYCFGLVFGAGWHEAAIYIRLLAPMYLLQFLVVPLSQTLNLLERQRLQFAWDLSRLVAVVGALMIPVLLRMGPLWTIGTYSAVMSLLYSLLLVIVYVVAQSGPHTPKIFGGGPK